MQTPILPIRTRNSKANQSQNVERIYDLIGENKNIENYQPLNLNRIKLRPLDDEPMAENQSQNRTPKHSQNMKLNENINLP